MAAMIKMQFAIMTWKGKWKRENLGNEEATTQEKSLDDAQPLSAMFQVSINTNTGLCTPFFVVVLVNNNTPDSNYPVA
jgi:hypothetical protein